MKNETVAQKIIYIYIYKWDAVYPIIHRKETTIVAI
jgi:hypothetical protein